MIAKVTTVKPNVIPDNTVDVSATRIDVNLASEKKNDAITNFLTSPSFNTKQIALESFWKQITQNSATIMQKTGQS